MALDGMTNSRRNGAIGGGRGWFYGGRGRGGSFYGGRFTGPPRRGPLNVNVRSSANGVSKSSYRERPFPWKRDLFDESLRAAGYPGVENGTKLHISNLNVGVSNKDIGELFSEFGQLERYAVHYGHNGRPNGSAEVVFARKSDAVQAHKKYNQVVLDGKHMKIEIVGASKEVPFLANANVVLPRVSVVGNPNVRRAVTMPRGGGRSFAAVNHDFGPRGRGRVVAAVNRDFRPRGRGRGFTSVNRGFSQMSPWVMRNARGRAQRQGGVWRKKVIDKSADELDKELDNYHAEAMQT